MLAEARTERAAAILLDQCRGALRREYDAIVASGSPPARIEELLARRKLGEHLTRPYQVVLAGAPNVGKSSLINALLGYDRAIVFDQPGTTRDVVSAITALDGWLVELSDTAGLRATLDPLEAAGVERTTQQLARADLILWVQDGSQPFAAAPPPISADIPTLIVWNKCDLLSADTIAQVPGLAVSALTGQGLANLQAEIVRALVPHPPAPGAAVPIDQEQVQLLSQLLVPPAQRD
jgi:tRNA modification GTPase